MSVAPIIHAIQERLRGAEYTDLAIPFKVAGVEFAFTAAMRGHDGRALDLVLVVDTTTGDFGDRVGASVRQRVEALSRALDVTGSRYVVTVILAGAVLVEGIEVLSETCRVLLVEGVALDDQGRPAGEVAHRQLDDCIRVLLPLTLPAHLAQSQNGSGPALEQLIRALPASTDSALVAAVIAASIDGEQAVIDTISQMINAAFQSDLGVKQS
ncbi:hypothetical protein PH586_12730 [Pseudomonas sp. SA3-5]|uniref:Uncharacterized protein n=1 Tax=Pseudomonas aestuarii TaxID=3018340 RepID=A0ABT4XGA0_9PSED|nr:hypothetical protein [Pseudomonas aestuarii]MDA7087251.1 hypothetical protein [Pseudomonas aestuarii]